MESIGIEAGSSPLSDAEARAFWDALAPIAMVPTFSDQPQPPVPQDLPGYWLTFWLPEGRAQQYFLDTDSGLLTDALGTESYAAGDLIGAVLPEAAAASRIEQDDPAGSSVLVVSDRGRRCRAAGYRYLDQARLCSAAVRRFVPWLNAVEDRYRLALNLCENPLNTSLTRANISARPRCAFFRSLSLERLFRDVRPAATTR